MPRLTSLDSLDWLLQAVPRSSSHESFSGTAASRPGNTPIQLFGPPGDHRTSSTRGELLRWCPGALWGSLDGPGPSGAGTWSNASQLPQLGSFSLRRSSELSASLSHMGAMGAMLVKKTRGATWIHIRQMMDYMDLNNLMFVFVY